MGFSNLTTVKEDLWRLELEENECCMSFTDLSFEGVLHLKQDYDLVSMWVPVILDVRMYHSVFNTLQQETFNASKTLFDLQSGWNRRPNIVENRLSDVLKISYFRIDVERRE